MCKIYLSANVKNNPDPILNKILNSPSIEILDTHIGANLIFNEHRAAKFYPTDDFPELDISNFSDKFRAICNPTYVGIECLYYSNINSLTIYSVDDFLNILQMTLSNDVATFKLAFNLINKAEPRICNNLIYYNIMRNIYKFGNIQSVLADEITTHRVCWCRSSNNVTLPKMASIGRHSPHDKIQFFFDLIKNKKSSYMDFQIYNNNKIKKHFLNTLCTVLDLDRLEFNEPVNNKQEAIEEQDKYDIGAEFSTTQSERIQYLPTCW